jgi:uncharacterized membrane protein YqiK
MEKAIALFQKSLEESDARAEAELAKARAVEASEQVQTVKDTEAARRKSSIDVLMAEKAAKEATLAAEAAKIRTAVEAEAQRLMNEAENVLTDPARMSLFRRKLLEHVEGIVSASVKPLEKINDIRIMQLDGIAGRGAGGDGGSDGSPTDEVINSALRYRVQAPLVDSLLADIGIDGANIARQGGLLREASDLNRIVQDQQRQARKSDGKSGGAGGTAKGKE